MSHKSKLKWLFCFVYLVAIALLMLIEASALMEHYSHNTLISLRQKQRVYFNDFAYFYVAGTIARTNPASCYDWCEQTRVLNTVLKIPPGFSPITNVHIQYVPLCFVLMIPFSLLSIDAARLITMLANLVLGLGGVILVARTKEQSGWRQVGILLAVVLVSGPSFLAIVQGQISYLLLAGVCLYSWSILKDRWIWGAVGLALASLKLQYLPFLCLPLLWGRLHKWFFGVAALSLILLICTGQILGWDNIFKYPERLLMTELTQPVQAEYMVCLRGLLRKFMVSSVADKLSFWAMGITFVGAGLLFRNLFAGFSSTDSKRWQITVSILLALIFSPHTHYYDSLLVAAIAALFLDDLSFSRLVEVNCLPYRCFCFLLAIYSWLTWINADGQMIVLILNCSLLACVLAFLCKKRSLARQFKSNGG